MRNILIHHSMPVTPKPCALRAPRLLAFHAAVLSFCFVIPALSTLRAQEPSASSSYTVLSVKPGEVIVRIAPKYSSTVIKDPSGHPFTEMTFPGGILVDSVGAPEVMRLALPLLAPSRTPAELTVLAQSLEVVPGTELAPVPTPLKLNGEMTEQYIVNDDRYYASSTATLLHADDVTPFRTAYSERILVSPIQYDAASHTVTRVRSLTLKIAFADAGTVTASPSPVTISSEESDFFRTIFINGSQASLYSGRARELPSLFRSNAATKQGESALSSESGAGQWLQITTTDAGVYHISAQDLANHHITGPIDPNSVELLGLGGEMLNESISDSSGAWKERAVEVH